MTKRLRWTTASILSLVMSLFLIAPSAFAGTKPKQATNKQLISLQNVAPKNKSLAGWLNNLVGINIVPQPRSTAASAAIIGGSAAAGAVAGGLLKGKKGAIIGALAGGAAGLIYDHKTAHRKPLIHY